MIQDITPHEYRNEYRPVKPEKESYVIVCKQNSILIKESEHEIAFPTFGEMECWNERLYEDYTYLFSIDQHRFYYIKDVSWEKLTEYHMEPVSNFRTLQPQYMAFAGITGAQLIRWYESRQFCGRCGAKMVHDGKERMMRCETCGLMEYPKICPAVIVGLTDGNRILMSKYAGRAYKKYALLAGFAEIGETIEETVRREVMEEVGLQVKNIRFYKSQPWSFSDTLLMGFYCELDGEDKITLDREELALAEWFEREDIPDMENDVSLTNEMIRYFKNHGNCVDNPKTHKV